jgi:hypothetical protein
MAKPKVNPMSRSESARVALAVRWGPAPRTLNIRDLPERLRLILAADVEAYRNRSSTRGTDQE